ncbi:hypothetical protein BDF21DRAFT_445029 [Thamnidium elegans]|nr:hypothetical protein BDF21DRAFT_445029 [Thamnidium elegans]
MSSLHVIDNQEQVAEPINQTLCEVCQKQFSNYVCPRCNLRYCSLACYKDLQHADCTESFYRDSVTAEIQNRDLDRESKNKMLEMLQRLEADNDSNGILEDDQEEEEEEEKYELIERFGNIDIENTDPDLIWDLLSDKEREEFQGVLNELQHDGDWDKFNLPTFIPWWKEDISLIRDPKEEHETKVPELPQTLPDFEKMTKPAARSSPYLAWNLLHILATYSYLIRHSMGDLLEDINDTVNITETLSAEVLFSNAASCPYSCVGDIVGDIVERIIRLQDKSDMIRRGKLNNNRRYDLKILLLQDMQDLLKKSAYATFDFWQALNQKKTRATMLATRKLYFYFAAACYLDKKRTDILISAMQNELTKIRVEKEDFQNEFEAAQNAIKQHEKESKVKIQEL